MLCITLEYPDGRVAIRGGLSTGMLARFGGDRRAALEYLIAEKVPEQNPGAVARIEDLEFPPDRTFRDAWKRGAGRVDVDMGKARQLHMERIRAMRNEKLAALDGKWMRAKGQDKQAEAAQVEAQRQRLRDIPQTFNLERYRTPEDLAAAWPDELADTA